tara:strand:- start:207 stop:407 length:201 start_codon:yes stop_codon:yes gene_type:complete
MVMALSKYDILVITGLIKNRIDHHNYLILEQELYEFGDKSTKRCEALRRDIVRLNETLSKVNGESL